MVMENFTHFSEADTVGLLVLGFFRILSERLKKKAF